MSIESIVTVACCNRNGARTLTAAIETVLAQDCSALEVLLIDDASTDESPAIIHRFAERDARVRVIRLRSRHGLAGAQNVALEQARSEYVAFIDADDLWRRQKLALQLRLMTEEVALVGCFSAVVDGDGAIRGWRLGRDLARPQGGVLSCDPVSGGSVALLRTAAVRSAGGFDETLQRRPDWDMWLRLSRHHRLRTVPRVLVGYRRGLGGLSSDYWQMVDEGRRILSKAAEVEPALTGLAMDRALASDLAGIAGLAAIDGSYGAARELYRAAGKLSRGAVLSPQRLYVRAALELGPPGRHILLERVVRMMAPRWVGAKVGEHFTLD